MHQLSQVTAQLIAVGAYTLIISSNQHPLSTALNCCTFVEYLGAIAENLDLAQQESFAGQKTLERIPLQLITGLAFKALDLGNYLGASLGVIITHGMEKPKDLATLGAPASGFTVTVLTNNTLIGSIAIE